MNNYQCPCGRPGGFWREEHETLGTIYPCRECVIGRAWKGRDEKMKYETESWKDEYSAD